MNTFAAQDKAKPRKEKIGALNFVALKLTALEYNADGSDGGVPHSELLGFWTLSTVRSSKY
jgi:hypothetical protein